MGWMLNCDFRLRLIASGACGSGGFPCGRLEWDCGLIIRRGCRGWLWSESVAVRVVHMGQPTILGIIQREGSQQKAETLLLGVFTLAMTTHFYFFLAGPGTVDVTGVHRLMPCLLHFRQHLPIPLLLEWESFPLLRNLFREVCLPPLLRRVRRFLCTLVLLALLLSEEDECVLWPFDVARITLPGWLLSDATTRHTSTFQMRSQWCQQRGIRIGDDS